MPHSHCRAPCRSHAVSSMELPRAGRAPSPMAVSWGTIAADTRSTLFWLAPCLRAVLHTDAHRAGPALRLAPTIPALAPTQPVHRGPYPLAGSEGQAALPSGPHARHGP